MQLKIDPDNGSPIYEQIVRQIKYAIAEGTLIPGQLVPSVRELAKAAAINPNTVQRAYLDLQNEEIIEPLRGRGMAVCGGAKRRCISDRQTQLRERLESLIREAVHAGLEQEQLTKMFEAAIQQATNKKERRIMTQVAVGHAVEIEKVTKRFGSKLVLDQVSFSVPTGSVFALLGENGAGKSTLIRSMLGYHRVHSGTIRVLGYDPLKQPMEIRRAVGYVSDSPAFYEWMTVEQVGGFTAGFYENGFVHRYLESAREFQLPSNTRIRDLSKGMRSKVALALATAFEPSLLILDEPTSGLDPVVRRQFLESMVERAAAGQTVFLSSHQIHEVERVADWIAILHRGVLQVVEPLESLKDSISNIRFSMQDPLLPLPSLFDECKLLRSEQTGRSWELTVRNASEDILARLSESESIFDVEVSRPSLEELYIAFTSDPRK